MKNYILFENHGLLDPMGLHMLGASPKRNDKNKIGRFGSGLKYALAVILRLNLDIRVFSGTTQIHIGKLPFTLGGQPFEAVTINGEKTSITTDAGPDWNEWRIIRELWCNALDEGAADLRKNVSEDNITGIENSTRIYVEFNQAMNDILSEWDLYFSDERNDAVILSDYLNAFPATNSKVLCYRKNIRVHSTDTNALYHYDSPSFEINEERELQNSYYVYYTLAELLAHHATVDVAANIIKRAATESTFEKEFKFEDYVLNENWITAAKSFDCIILQDRSGYHVDKMKKTDNLGIVSGNLGKALSVRGIPVLGLTAEGKRETYTVHEKLTAKQQFMITDVIKVLENEMNYTVKYPVYVVAFNIVARLAEADLKNRRILISETLFDHGRREIALAIMEEQEHLDTELSDETRGLQNHLFRKWLSALEEKAGYFL